MTTENHYIDIPKPSAGLRQHPGLEIEVWDENGSATVRLTPSHALKVAQYLLFDAREMLDKAEHTFNETERRHRLESANGSMPDAIEAKKAK